MHDIWNPWHGCKKISEGCKYCYMYTLDQRYDKDGAMIYKTKNTFDYPLQKNRKGEYKIKSGELIRVCMTSDFFLEEADPWRKEVWQIIKKRSDVKFYLLTKRADRIKQCLPEDWNDGYDNVILNVTCENQQRANERIPILFEIPAKHKGIMCAPLIDKIDLSNYLKQGILEQVTCGGENYDGDRPCNFDWVLQLHHQCKKYHVSFSFIETGTYFIKDQKGYYIEGKRKQSRLAYKAKLNFIGHKADYHLVDETGKTLEASKLYVPHYRLHCKECGSRLTCNGCSDCGRCKEAVVTKDEMDAFDKRNK